MSEEIATKMQKLVPPQEGQKASGGVFTTAQLKEETDKKIEGINTLLTVVVIVLLVMVATLIIDSFHFNSATYKEYSQKTSSLEQIQKINQELLEENQTHKQMIIEQQRQILEFLKTGQ